MQNNFFTPLSIYLMSIYRFLWVRMTYKQFRFWKKSCKQNNFFTWYVLSASSISFAISLAKFAAAP